MGESKTERVILIFIVVTLTGLVSVVFQNNLIVYLVGFIVALGIYFFGYPIRKKLVNLLIDPLKRIIGDLELYDKVKENPRLQKKAIKRLYNHLKLTEFLEGSLRVIPSNSPIKPSFTFQKGGEDPLLTIQFFRLPGDQPYRFQISGKNVNYFSHLEKQAPTRTLEENTENLAKLLSILNEFI